MSLEDNVAEVDGAAVQDDVVNTPDTETDSTQKKDPTLDELLSEYDSSAQQHGQPKQETQVTPKTDEKGNAPLDERLNRVLEHFDRQEQERVQEQVQSDISKATELAKKAGGIDHLDNFLVESYLRRKIETNDTLLKVWQNRRNDSAKFDAVVKAIGRELSKTQKDPVDPKTTESVNAVEAAVSGSRRTQSNDDAPDFHKMSNAEFQKWERENLSG